MASKPLNLARAILKCRLLNERMGKSPKVLFPSVEDLFYLFLFFFPVVHTGTADFRHCQRGERGL